jgi:uncharacterized membrane protein YGL010W
MRSADEWFVLYGESHQNPTNKMLHWVCVPLILLSTLGLLWSIPSPYLGHVWINWATIVVVISLLFYISLSISIFLGMTLGCGLCLWIVYAVNASATSNFSFLWGSIFLGAWLGQFIGHKIEGRKPSFFQDLQFLLVGPAWLLHFIYKKAGIPYSKN